MIDVLDVNAPCVGALLHHQTKQLKCGDGFFANRWVGFVLRVQLFKTRLIGKKRFVQIGHIVWRKQCDVLILNQALVHGFVQLHAIVHVAYAVLFHATVVFQYQ